MRQAFLSIIFFIFPLIFLSPNVLTYLGIIYCFILSSLGTAFGIWAISPYVSGTSIKHPNVGAKSILGAVVCETNFLSGIITCIMTYNRLKNDVSIAQNYIYYSSCIFVGACNYFSSISTGLICAVISMMDGKNPSVFYKTVVLEIIPASVGLIGFILGIIFNSKAELLK